MTEHSVRGSRVVFVSSTRPVVTWTDLCFLTVSIFLGTFVRPRSPVSPRSVCNIYVYPFCARWLSLSPTYYSHRWIRDLCPTVYVSDVRRVPVVSFRLHFTRDFHFGRLPPRLNGFTVSINPGLRVVRQLRSEGR